MWKHKQLSKVSLPRLHEAELVLKASRQTDHSFCFRHELAVHLVRVLARCSKLGQDIQLWQDKATCISRFLLVAVVGGGGGRPVVLLLILFSSSSSLARRRRCGNGRNSSRSCFNQVSAGRLGEVLYGLGATPGPKQNVSVGSVPGCSQ